MPMSLDDVERAMDRASEKRELDARNGQSQILPQHRQVNQTQAQRSNVQPTRQTRRAPSTAVNQAEMELMQIVQQMNGQQLDDLDEQSAQLQSQMPHSSLAQPVRVSAQPTRSQTGQKLVRYGAQITLGLTNADGTPDQNKVNLALAKTQEELIGHTNALKVFFRCVFDQEDVPPPELLISTVMGLMGGGEWIFVFSRQNNTLVGVAHITYGHPNRECYLTVCPFADTFDLESLTSYIFRGGALYPFLKIKVRHPLDRPQIANVRAVSDHEMFLKAGFVQTGSSAQDMLLDGVLRTTINYECFDPQLMQTAGQEIEDFNNVDALEHEQLVSTAATRQLPDERSQSEQSSDAALASDRSELGAPGAEDSPRRVYARLRKPSVRRPNRE